MAAHRHRLYAVRQRHGEVQAQRQRVIETPRSPQSQSDRVPRHAPGLCAVVVMIGTPQDPHVLAEKLGVAPKAAETTTGAKAQPNGQASTRERAESQPVNLN